MVDMDNKLDNKLRCDRCANELGEVACTNEFGGAFYSVHCADEDQLARSLAGKVWRKKEVTEVELNEPDHYHQHDMDTIEFLKRGFPPNVLTGFLIGNIIKYTQRYEYKNGEEDLMKIVDYAKRLREWHKETHTF